jgi:hypothetical protein
LSAGLVFNHAGQALGIARRREHHPTPPRPTAGSPKASTRPISKRQRHCSSHWREPATSICRNPTRMSAPWPARPSMGMGQEWLLKGRLEPTDRRHRTTGIGGRLSIHCRSRRSAF